MKLSQRKIDSEIRKHFKEYADFIIEKNHAYGNSLFDTLNVFGTGSITDIVKIRMDDKLKKMIKGSNLAYEHEDAAKDFCGYWHLLQIVNKLINENKEGKP
jgi:hypothetical protein